MYGNHLIQPTFCKREFAFNCLWQARFDGTSESVNRNPTCLGAGMNYLICGTRGFFIVPTSFSGSFFIFWENGKIIIDFKEKTIYNTGRNTLPSIRGGKYGNHKGRCKACGSFNLHGIQSNKRFKASKP